MKLGYRIITGSALLFILFSCRKNSEISISKLPPVTSFEFTREIYLKQSKERKITSYSSNSDTNVVSVLNNAGFGMTITSKPLPDDVSFGVNFEKLKTQYTGDYSLRSFSNPNYEASFAYSYSFYETGGSHGHIVFGSWFNTAGQFTISDFQIKDSTISGKFNVVIQDVPDPSIDDRSSLLTESNNCTITINGTFKNVLVKK